MKYISILSVVLLFVICTYAQRELGARPTDTGGPLMFEQAVYDVQNYDISLKVDPASKTISGTTIMTARTVIPTNIIVLDLDMPVMTGYAFRQAQMAYPHLSGIPVVLFSADPNVAETATQMQVQAYAAKPAEPKKLLAIILRHCVR